MYKSCLLFLILNVLLNLMTPSSVAARTMSEQHITEQQLGINYQELLNKHKLTGVSVAIVDNYRIVARHVAGEKSVGTGDLIDVKTAFSTASMSKPVTATIAAMLAEKGVIDWDMPVNHYLTRWQLAESDFTQDRPVTIRDLLTHTAGTSQSGYADFYQGDDNIPTLMDTLNGKNLPRYEKPVHVRAPVGEKWDYSGGGYVVVQAAIEDITQKTLQQLAKTMLFDPLNMTHTTMYQPDSPKFLANVAKVHNDDQQVIKTGLPICPQIAPSGMWSTPSDLANFLIDYQMALAGKPSRVISPKVAAMTTQIHTLNTINGMSAGWFRLEADGNLDWFSHGGSNTGTGGEMRATMEGGRALVILGNGGNGARIPVIKTIKKTTIEQLGWSQSLSLEPDNSPLPQTLVSQWVGEYKQPFAFLKEPAVVTAEEGKLYISGMMKLWHAPEKYALIYVGDGKFTIDEMAGELSLKVNPDDKRTYLVRTREGTTLLDYSMLKL